MMILYIVYSSAMCFGLLSCFCEHWNTLQWWPIIPSHRCSNPHKLYIIMFTIGPTVTYRFLVIAAGSTSAASSVRLKYPIFYKTAHWPTTISYTTLPILTARSIYKYNMSALLRIATPSSHHKGISAKFIAVMKSVFLHLFTFSKAMNAGWLMKVRKMIATFHHFSWKP